MTPEIKIGDLWEDAGFKPNDAQREAILHSDGPLFLPAGPGSGKTRVLLWRTLNLIVFHGIPTDEIYLSTFTEKAAQQLREGLRSLLGAATIRTGRPYDIGRMYVGTVHSLCTKLLLDRRFRDGRDRGQTPVLLDDLDQYLWISRKRVWNELLAVGGFSVEPELTLNRWFDAGNTQSKYTAISNCLALFNRFSEECVVPLTALKRTEDATLQSLLRMYERYCSLLETERSTPQTDFSLLQQHALRVLDASFRAGEVFKHVIIDEYQDTNTVQERLFFRLTHSNKNLCVVGDDDQALYRFRGATVENFVEFPERCRAVWNVSPREIPLATNYRSRAKIVDFYGRFMQECDWKKTTGLGHHRVVNKKVVPHSTDDSPAVVTTSAASPEVACSEIAAMVKRLVEDGRVENANQIAFLYPSLKSPHVGKMMAALEAVGLRTYAPRAGTFLATPEATAMLGLFAKIIGRPLRGDFPGQDYANFHAWLDAAEQRAAELVTGDELLGDFVRDRQADLERSKTDYAILLGAANQNRWSPSQPYEAASMRRAFHDAPRLSTKAKAVISSSYVQRLVAERESQGRPFAVDYLLKRATSVDWSLLDLFWRLSGFNHFREMFDLAHRPVDPDEGPICNLSLLSQYIGRFMDRRAPIVTGALLQDDLLPQIFFASYCYTLHKRGESEYEDADDPFPKGRIPFLTIHQSKGLEFPVVVLGNLRKDDNGPQHIEEVVRPLLDREGEPLERLAMFDIMRMYYVALSRAKNLLIVANYRGRGQRMNAAFRTLLDGSHATSCADLDVTTVPTVRVVDESVPRSYSYTADYLHYQRCPRQYMVFREYAFVPSRSQTMLFGTLVHRTLDDLHQWLIGRKAG